MEIYDEPGQLLDDERGVFSRDYRASRTPPNTGTLVAPIAPGWEASGPLRLLDLDHNTYELSYSYA